MSSSPPHRRRQEAVVDWAALPTDLLPLIAEKLGSIINFFRLRAVCTRWRSAPMPPLQFSPLLLLPFNPDDNLLPLFDPSLGNLYSLPLPEARRKALLGSSHGWLVLIDDSAAISLLNPFTRAQFRLPPVTRQLALASKVKAERADGDRWIVHHPYMGKRTPVTLYHMRITFISEVTLFCSPASKVGSMALAVLPRSSKIAFCRVGDTAWNLLETGVRGHIQSAAYCEGKIFAVDANGEVVSCDLGPPATAVRASSPPSTHWYNNFRILAVGKELVLVAHFKVPGTSRFEDHYAIYRSGLEGRLEWSKVESIKDMTLFLSTGFNLNTLCGEFSEFKKNTVYFSEADVGIEAESNHCIQVVDTYGSSEVVSCNLAVQSPRDVSWFMPHLA